MGVFDHIVAGLYLRVEIIPITVAITSRTTDPNWLIVCFMFQVFIKKIISNYSKLYFFHFYYLVLLI